MIIIVEGSDCAGKSTFVSLLHDRLTSAQVLWSGPPAPGADPYQEYEARLYEPLDEGRPVIADRWHWGEPVYGPVLRDHDRLLTPGWRHIELFLATQGAVVVYLHQPLSVLRERLATRGDDLVDRDHLLVAIEVGYQWCLRHTVLPVISLRDPTPDDATMVVRLALTRSPWRTHLPYFPSYIGHRRPRALLFGERRGGPGPHVFRSAFVPVRATSGYHLLNCLPEALWGHLGVCNSLEEEPLLVWKTVGQPPAVALGREAHRALDDVGVPHGTVPHPQYVRRFLHRELLAYGRLIQRVIVTGENRLDWRGDPQADEDTPDREMRMTHE